jgi:hypothetical protein
MDPSMELRDANGADKANDNWRNGQQAGIAPAPSPQPTTEPAIVWTLTPGNYTTIVCVNNTTGSSGGNAISISLKRGWLHAHVTELDRRGRHVVKVDLTLLPGRGWQPGHHSQFYRISPADQPACTSTPQTQHPVRYRCRDPAA